MTDRHSAAVSFRISCIRTASARVSMPGVPPPASAAAAPAPSAALRFWAQLEGAVYRIDRHLHRHDLAHQTGEDAGVHLVRRPCRLRCEPLLEFRRQPIEMRAKRRLIDEPQLSSQVHRHVVPGRHLPVPGLLVPVRRDVAVGAGHDQESGGRTGVQMLGQGIGPHQVPRDPPLLQHERHMGGEHSLRPGRDQRAESTLARELQHKVARLLAENGVWMHRPCVSTLQADIREALCKITKKLFVTSGQEQQVVEAGPVSAEQPVVEVRSIAAPRE